MKKRPHHKSNESAKVPAKYITSTASAGQRYRILCALRSGAKTTYELQKMGCYFPPARVHELRKQGYGITTHRVMIVDAEGFRHHGVGLYTLVSVPEVLA